MPTIAEVMTPDVEVIGPNQSLQRAAQMMDELNVGALPVCDGRRLVGIVSLGDLAVRQGGHVDSVLREVSQPSQPDRPAA